MKTRYILLVAGATALVSLAAAGGIYLALNRDGLPLCTDLRTPAQVTKAISDHPGFVEDLSRTGAMVSVGMRNDCGPTVGGGYILVTYPIGSRGAVVEILSRKPDMDVGVGLTPKF